MIHHVELYVADLAKSKDYWGWLLSELGYEKFQEWEQGVSFKKEKAYIVFVQTEEKYVEAGYHRKRIGLNHLAFWAKSIEQVDNLADQMRSRGMRLLYEDRYPFAGGRDHYALYGEDPDRIKVEIVAEHSLKE
ncbi:VOC family protein [Jeotgalibacillus proteolyticus]|uniref:VOC domain-containing protein n=1 Tax=Jeotgalibacillus proteolyticus TaxID=2082395 RepID=A0A2S5G9R2_9BACL|nr:VOC family protein [Jeotgalibacillus proteolyticus]PPA69742.1 hypothetical protein C4B60_14485 [Jeotgalibacillus proteolyticus]